MTNGIWDGLKPTFLMVIVQIIYASTNILYKLAINNGMSVKILTAYRLMFASGFIIPLALILERNTRPKLTWRVLFMSFLCGLCGMTLFQNLFLEALALISATFASAVSNLIPAMTFILAVCCGFEKLNLRKASGIAKVVGSILGVGGAMIMTFVKGAEIKIWSSHIHLLHENALSSPHGSKLVTGVICGLASCISFAIWLMIQAKMSQEYPTPYSSTALVLTMGAIQSTIYALCVERDWTQWKLHYNFRLLTAVYSGIVCSGVVGVIITWCVKMRGPLFAAVFDPLFLVLMAIIGSLCLDENLYLGSVVGAILVVVGLYAVLWGKNREMRRMSELAPTNQSNQEQSEVNRDVEAVD